ncbi:oxidoreductase [Amycolatopsis methanolica 239]|uniref:Oxidoreductase n=1 Tax=Amycolatopsis methanolica 239 TaxID=1068978 RepID=A0A076N6E5_AMYME|nr:oxidoreductase [Amycolatopsis methanolica 239]
MRARVRGAQLISALPAGPGRALLGLTSKTSRVHDAMTVEDYGSAR